MDDYYLKLKEYLQQQHRRGEAIETTRATLIQHGWESNMVDQAIADLAPPTPPFQLPEPLGELHHTGPTEKPAATAPVVSEPAEQEVQTYQPYGTAAYVGHNQPPADTSSKGATIAKAAEPSHAVSGNIPQPTAKYGIIRGILDALSAIIRNPVPFLAASAAAILVSIGLLALSDKVVYGIVSLHVITSDAPASIVFITFLLSSFVSFLITMAAYSLIQFVSNFVMFESGEGRKPTLQHLISDARKRLLKLLLANFLVGIVAIGPIVLLSNVFLALTLSPLAGAGAKGTSNAVTFVLWIAVLAWLIIAVLRYALAPIVAMFESNTSVLGSLRRSRLLLTGGGQWFIGKLLLVVLVAGIGLSAISGEQVRALDSTDSPLVNGGLVILEVLLNGALLMLYRNRRMVKDATS